MEDRITDCDVYMIVDSDGNHAVGVDLDAAKQAFEDNIGELAAVEGWRLVVLSVKVPKPVPVELHGIAPEQGTATLTVK